MKQNAHISLKIVTHSEIILLKTLFHESLFLGLLIVVNKGIIIYAKNEKTQIINKSRVIFK